VDNEIAKRLNIKPGASALRLELLRHADRVPLCAATTWLDAQRFPNAAGIYGSTNSTTRMLARFGVRNYSRKSTHVTAAIAEAADAASLRIALGRPLLVVDSVDVDETGRPILTTTARFAGDRLELMIET
jgi:GntR family phosphonate transport system transcriptional regulator